MLSTEFAPVPGRLLLLTIISAFSLTVGCGDDGVTDAGPDSMVGDTGGGDSSDPDAGDAMPDATSSCDLPIEGALTLPDSVDATLSGTGVNPSTSCTSDMGTGGPEHYYELVITAATGVEVSATGTFEMAVTIRTACDDPLSELGCGRSDDPAVGPSPGPATVRSVLDPGTYFVVVDTLGFGVGGDYTLTVSEFTAPTHSTCAAAMAVTAGTVLPDEDLDLSASSAGTCSSGATNALYYEITVPAGEGLSVQPMGVGPTGPPELEVLDGCADPSCLASSAGTRVVYANTSGADETVIVSLRGAGRHSLAFDTFPVPTNTTCATARSVADGTSLSGEWLSFGSEDATACFATVEPSSRTLYYTADVPAGELFTARAVLTDVFAPGVALSLLDGCASGATCLESAGSGIPAPGTEGPQALAWQNTGGSTATVVLAVTGFEMGLVDLDTTIGPPPSNSDCSMATPVTDGASLPTEFVTTATDTLGAACLPGATGAVMYYSATIPAGETLTASARPNGSAITSLRVLSACGASSCLDSGTGSVTHTNTGSTAESVVIAVGLDADPFPPPDVTTADSFSLSVVIGLPPYIETTITGACDDMSTATPLPGPVGDDTTSALTAIPFAFEFFGDASTHYSVSSNGLMQVWPSATGAPSTEFNNFPIPEASAPNGFIAPLWDDLFPGTVSTLTSGTAPNRKLTVEWTRFSFFRDRAASVTFQAQLYETSNVIELHYCTLTAGAEPDAPGGVSATVGLEGPLGAVGVSHSYDTASSVDTTNGIRFTP